MVPSIRQWAAETDAVFQSSAAQTGGTRRIRFVTDKNCDLVVTRVALSATGDDTLDTTIAELAAQGYRRSDRKYLVWMDSTVLCGIGTYYVDDRPTPDNFNNGRSGVPGSVSRIDAGCWGLASRGQSVEAHELMHSLGAVLPTAPNATTNGHCSDDDDRMCYADGSPSWSSGFSAAPTRKPSSTATTTTTSTPPRPPGATWPPTGTEPAAPSCPARFRVPPCP